MKGYCPKCGKEVDEVEYTQFKGMCEDCTDMIEYLVRLRVEFSDCDTKTQDELIKEMCIRILKLEEKVFHLEEES